MSAETASLTEHLGTGRHYNINSKRGSLSIMYAESNQVNDIYNTDIAAYIENMDLHRENDSAVCSYRAELYDLHSRLQRIY